MADDLPKDLRLQQSCRASCQPIVRALSVFIDLVVCEAISVHVQYVTCLSVAVGNPYDLVIHQNYASKIRGRARTHIVVQTYLERWCVGVYKPVDGVECQNCLLSPKLTS